MLRSSLIYSIVDRLIATVTSPVNSEHIAKNGNNKQPFIIGVSGGTFSGKTCVCKKIVELMKEKYSELSWNIAIIYQDYFLKSLSVNEQRLAKQSKYDFDHPGAYDTELMKITLNNLILGKSVQIPKYNLQTQTRESVELQPCDVVLFEGVFIFYFQEIRDFFNLKLFVDSDADTRLSRRVMLEVVEKNKSLESVLQRYTTCIKPAFEEFCLPSKKYADVVIPRGVENLVAINLIVQHVHDFLKGGRLKRLQSRISEGEIAQPPTTSAQYGIQLLHPSSMNRRH